ncbi:MAG: DNA polymerase III subunit chi [Maritimibacter sp.]
MSEAFFYHMTETPLEVTLPILLSKARGAGWEVVVRALSEDRLRWLDERLWLDPVDGFLPHGIAGGPHDADQPILLTTQSQIAGCLVSVDGAAVQADEVAATQRTMVLFDGNHEGAVEAARNQWRSLTSAGIKAKYWSQETGRWELKAESGALNGSE